MFSRGKGCHTKLIYHNENLDKALPHGKRGRQTVEAVHPLLGMDHLKDKNLSRLYQYEEFTEKWAFQRRGRTECTRVALTWNLRGFTLKAVRGSKEG